MNNGYSGMQVLWDWDIDIRAELWANEEMWKPMIGKRVDVWGDFGSLLYLEDGFRFCQGSRHP
jgi:hypothetical protein